MRILPLISLGYFICIINWICKKLLAVMWSLFLITNNRKIQESSVYILLIKKWDRLWCDYKLALTFSLITGGNSHIGICSIRVGSWCCCKSNYGNGDGLGELHFDRCLEILKKRIRYRLEAGDLCCGSESCWMRMKKWISTTKEFFYSCLATRREFMIHCLYAEGYFRYTVRWD